jgi:uncharacterized protein YbbC (DUF1343 family)
MYLLFSVLLCCLSATGCKNRDSKTFQSSLSVLHIDSLHENSYTFSRDILTGSQQVELYISLLKNKNIACVVNQTSTIGNTHLIDSLSSLNANINLIFAPEHGFRGEADAGGQIDDSKDIKTGIPIISIYGDKKKPSPHDLSNIDIVIFDIQDVGARFYTYISTLHYVMEACAENSKPLIILDRPNPNGFYVDGPVLQKGFSSFVGMHPVPVVHGMTIGEYAQMINGAKWLANEAQCELKIIPCKNYDHKYYYEVTIPPSPNLRTMHSIYLYPSICFFEGTNVSVGRGTKMPFEIIGSPFIAPTKFTFTPVSMPGATSPPFKDQLCYGYNLSFIDTTELYKNQINLKWLLLMYNQFNNKQNFFLENNFFDKLAGTDELRKQIIAGLSQDEIRLSWQDELSLFKQIRKKYLLYPDFEN